jgi:hypothetical protein
MTDFYTDEDVEDVLVKAKERQKALAIVIGEIKAAIGKTEVELRRRSTGAAAAGGGAPPAPVATLFQNTLPRVKVDLFEGDESEWFSFWDLYKSIVDNMQAPDVQKFSYLVSLLRGEPRDLLRGLPITAANYPAAKAILEERYNSIEKAVRKLRNELLFLPTCRTIGGIGIGGRLWLSETISLLP